MHVFIHWHQPIMGPSLMKFHCCTILWDPPQDKKTSLRWVVQKIQFFCYPEQYGNLFYSKFPLPACRRQANVPRIPKSPPFSSDANNRPISITPVLSNVVVLGVSSSSSIYPPSLLSTLCVSHTLQRALESGQDSRISQIDFSTAFYRVNQNRILYKLCSVGIGGKSYELVFRNILSCKYIAPMGIQMVSASVKKMFLHVNTSHPWVYKLY